MNKKQQYECELAIDLIVQPLSVEFVLITTMNETYADKEERNDLVTEIKGISVKDSTKEDFII